MTAAAAYDVAIVGGGMVGASLLCALLPVVERHGLRVAVIEAVPLEPGVATQNASTADYQPSYDARSTALSWGSRNIYTRLGLWPELAQRATAIRRIHVSDRGHFGAVRIRAADYGLAALGYVVENRWLGQVLLDAVKNAAISYFCPATVTAIDPLAHGAQLTLVTSATKQKITAALVVIADGGRSELAQQLPLDATQRDYRQQAIIANVTAQQPHANVAYERFTDEGPLALLPLDETPSRAAEQSRCALVLTVATATADGLMKLDDGHFLTAIQDRFGYRLGRLQRVGKRYCYPLQLRCIKDQVRPGVVVIGNAAHRLHPVAGQGFNLALRGVADLATVIAEACAQRQPLNGSSLLQTYQQLRAADQRRTVALSDYLIRLFANNGRLLSRARSLGLIALDTLPFAKKLFAQQAMGFAPSMPPAPGRR